jgi:hypothetical protein
MGARAKRDGNEPVVAVESSDSRSCNMRMSERDEYAAGRLMPGGA